MYFNVSDDRYRKLVRQYFKGKPALALWFLKNIPNPDVYRKMTINEKRFVKSRDPEKIGKLLTAIELGQLIVKSPYRLYGHAYSTSLVGQAFIEEYRGESQESVTILCTDVHNEIIARQKLFVGGSSQCSLFPDQVYRYALKNNASGVIVVHNHPSGQVEPSDNDYQMCKRLDHSGRILGIHLLDFIVVGHDRYYSWREEMSDL